MLLFIAFILLLLVASPWFRAMFVPLLFISAASLYVGTWVLSGGLTRAVEPQKVVAVETDEDYSACDALPSSRSVHERDYNLECLFAVAAGERLASK